MTPTFDCADFFFSQEFSPAPLVFALFRVFGAFISLKRVYKATIVLQGKICTFWVSDAFIWGGERHDFVASAIEKETGKYGIFVTRVDVRERSLTQQGSDEGYP